MFLLLYATQEDNPKTLYNTGVECLKQNNFTEAFSYFQQAAKLNFMPAKVNLGLMHYRGDGVQKNLKTAETLFRDATRSGIKEAQYFLATMYLKGEIRTNDNPLVQARNLYLASATQDYLPAQFNLAMMLYCGKGGEQDSISAVHWFVAASTQGYQPAKDILRKLADAKKNDYLNIRN